MKKGYVNYPELFASMISILAFFIIMFFVTIGTFFGCSSAWICTFIRVKPCKDKYDVCEIPRRRGANAWSMLVVNFAALLMIGSAIYGFLVFNDMFAKVNYNECAISALMDEIAEGKINEKWKGMTPFIGTLDNITE